MRTHTQNVLQKNSGARPCDIICGLDCIKMNSDDENIRIVKHVVNFEPILVDLTNNDYEEETESESEEGDTEQPEPQPQNQSQPQNESQPPSQPKTQNQSQPQPQP